MSVTGVEDERIGVAYTSAWDEGEVETVARLDPSTGAVTDIDAVEVPEDGLGSLLREYVTLPDGTELDVREVDGRHAVADPDALAAALVGSPRP